MLVKNVQEDCCSASLCSCIFVCWEKVAVINILCIDFNHPPFSGGLCLPCMICTRRWWSKSASSSALTAASHVGSCGIKRGMSIESYLQLLTPPFSAHHAEASPRPYVTCTRRFRRLARPSSASLWALTAARRPMMSTSPPCHLQLYLSETHGASSSPNTLMYRVSWDFI